MIKINKNQVVNVFFHWLPIGGTIVLLGGLTYAVVQQNYRQSLNDPQVQVSEDVAAGLSEGRTLNQLSQQIDIAKSLANYVIVYNKDGQPVGSSGILDGQIPIPPKGVFEYTKQHKQDRITWEPKPGVRSAIVITWFETDKLAGFVLSGRGMREVEQREAGLLKMICLGTLVTLVLTFILDFIGDLWRQKAMSSTSEDVKTEEDKEEGIEEESPEVE